MLELIFDKKLEPIRDSMKFINDQYESMVAKLGQIEQENKALKLKNNALKISTTNCNHHSKTARSFSRRTGTVPQTCMPRDKRNSGSFSAKEYQRYCSTNR